MTHLSLVIAALLMPGQAAPKPVAAPAVAAAPAPVSRQVTELAIYPPDIQLASKRSKQVVVVQASFSDGITEDVTAKCNLRLENASLGKLEGQTIHPVADGNSRVLADFGGKSAAAPIAVSQATAERPVSFKLDVMPVFMRSGCNTGSCHGAARGKDGFMLSLFGYDPDGDHYRITHELGNRRINLLARPTRRVFQQPCHIVAHILNPHAAG